MISPREHRRGHGQLCPCAVEPDGSTASDPLHDEHVGAVVEVLQQGVRDTEAREVVHPLGRLDGRHRRGDFGEYDGEDASEERRRRETEDEAERTEVQEDEAELEEEGEETPRAVDPRGLRRIADARVEPVRDVEQAEGDGDGDDTDGEFDAPEVVGCKRSQEDEADGDERSEGQVDDEADTEIPCRVGVDFAHPFAEREADTGGNLDDDERRGDDGLVVTPDRRSEQVRKEQKPTETDAGHEGLRPDGEERLPTDAQRLSVFHQ